MIPKFGNFQAQVEYLSDHPPMISKFEYIKLCLKIILDFTMVLNWYMMNKALLSFKGSVESSVAAFYSKFNIPIRPILKPSF